MHKKPDNTGKDVAKSLHTLTVIVQVARLMKREAHDPAFTYADALDDAMTVLELAGRPDPYGLKARALAILEA